MRIWSIEEYYLITFLLRNYTILSNRDIAKPNRQSNVILIRTSEHCWVNTCISNFETEGLLRGFIMKP